MTPGTIYLSGVEPLMPRPILTGGEVCSEVAFDLDSEKSWRQLVQQQLYLNEYSRSTNHIPVMTRPTHLCLVNSAAENDYSVRDLIAL